MNAHEPRPRQTRGSGRWRVEDFATFGSGSVIEEDVLVFHAPNISIGIGVYVGHATILNGYHAGHLAIGDGSWIGEQVYLHAAGGIAIGRNVGIGPGVRVITSTHREVGPGTPIMHGPLEFAAVTIEDDADLGVGSIVLPGITIGRGAQIGAGSVVTRDVPPLAIAAGVPARVLRTRA